MKKMADLPNIGQALAERLDFIGTKTQQDLKEFGSENTIIKISTIENCGTCINRLYAL